ncbi:MAG: hypothetical protein EOP56_11675 [Sphingobacteriales bacterium]|nr:MAG: hypothetical protein EOP56_11675 [Sphingobacteriales bacterium]
MNIQTVFLLGVFSNVQICLDSFPCTAKVLYSTLAENGDYVGIFEANANLTIEEELPLCKINEFWVEHIVFTSIPELTKTLLTVPKSRYFPLISLIRANRLNKILYG